MFVASVCRHVRTAIAGVTGVLRTSRHHTYTYRQQQQQQNITKGKQQQKDLMRSTL